MSLSIAHIREQNSKAAVALREIAQILEDDEDWGGDTFEDISRVLHQGGYADSDDQGMFRAKRYKHWPGL